MGQLNTIRTINFLCIRIGDYEEYNLLGCGAL
jgi:hypothetical protein